MAHILLIDDDEFLRPALRLILTHFGHTVIEARDGKEGLALFGHMLPDVVITDIVMPEKEGMAVLLELRQRGCAAKIIAMSGGGRQSAVDYLHMAKLLGADRVLSKPFSNETLLAAVAAVLAERGAPLPPVSGPPRVPATTY